MRPGGHAHRYSRKIDLTRCMQELLAYDVSYSYLVTVFWIENWLFSSCC